MARVGARPPGTMWLFAVVAAAVVLAPLSVAAEPSWYKSDSLGTPGDPIPAPTAGTPGQDSGYVLAVSRSGTTETQRLYSGGVLETRTVTARDDGGRVRERTVYRGEKIFRKETYDQAGNLSEETFFQDGEAMLQTTYTYRDGRPETAVAYRYSDSDGGRVRDDKPVWTDTYSYYPGSTTGPSITGTSAAGALRAVRRAFADGTERISRYDYSGSRIIEEWQGESTTGILTRYDAGGRLALRETWKSGTLEERESFSYGTKNALESSRIENPGDKTVTDRTYDGGKIASETVSRDGKQVSRTENRYKNGKLTSRSVTEAGTTEEWRYVYDDSGKKTEESYLRNGVLIEVVRYTADGAYIRDHYRDGKLVLRSYFEGERRVKEELVRDGKVVRTLTF